MRVRQPRGIHVPRVGGILGRVGDSRAKLQERLAVLVGARRRHPGTHVWDGVGTDEAGVQKREEKQEKIKKNWQNCSKSTKRIKESTGRDADIGSRWSKQDDELKRLVAIKTPLKKIASILKRNVAGVKSHCKIIGLKIDSLPEESTEAAEAANRESVQYVQTRPCTSGEAYCNADCSDTEPDWRIDQSRFAI